MRACVCMCGMCAARSVSVPAKVSTTALFATSECVDVKRKQNTHINTRKRERKEENYGYNTTMFPGGPPPQYTDRAQTALASVIGRERVHYG